MSQQPLRPYLSTLGWSRDELARRLGCDQRLLRRWEAHGVPQPVLAWLDAAAAWHHDNPPPAWRTRRVVDGS